MNFKSENLDKINIKKCNIGNGEYGFYVTHDENNILIP